MEQHFDIQSHIVIDKKNAIPIPEMLQLSWQNYTTLEMSFQFKMLLEEVQLYL